MLLGTYNIWEGGFLQGPDRRDKIRELIVRHRPDILCLQETPESISGILAAPDTYYVLESEDTSVSIVSKERPSEVVVIGERVVFAAFQVGGDTLDVYNVHMPFHPLQDQVRREMIEEVLQHTIKRNSLYSCIVGDFNSRALANQG
jgi:endonuclease/exonuclease/phosphatase family metal-dependent hydrolase